MLKKRKWLWYTLSLQIGLYRWVAYQIIFLPTALTACTPHSFSSLQYTFSSHIQFHVHMYISCWGPGEQSPSLEIIFNSWIPHVPCPTPLARLAPTQWRRWKLVRQCSCWACCLHSTPMLACATDWDTPCRDLSHPAATPIAQVITSSRVQRCTIMCNINL